MSEQSTKLNINSTTTSHRIATRFHVTIHVPVQVTTALTIEGLQLLARQPHNASIEVRKHVIDTQVLAGRSHKDVDVVVVENHFTIHGCQRSQGRGIPEASNSCSRIRRIPM